MTDAGAEPAVQALPATRERRIGAYIGVPVLLSDGSQYGMLCGMSHATEPTLNQRGTCASCPCWPAWWQRRSRPPRRPTSSTRLSVSGSPGSFGRPASRWSPTHHRLAQRAGCRLRSIEPIHRAAGADAGCLVRRGRRRGSAGRARGGRRRHATAVEAADSNPHGDQLLSRHDQPPAAASAPGRGRSPAHRARADPSPLPSALDQRRAQAPTPVPVLKSRRASSRAI